MPEGHTIHRLARDQGKRYVGQSLKVSSPQGKFIAGAEELSGRTLVKVEAYGKHLFYWWDRSLLLHVHLGLYGKFRNHRSPPPEPRGAVRLRVIGDQHAFDLNGPTACNLLHELDRAKILKRLGQDPLRKDSDPEIAWQRISRSRAAIGSLLLDQSVIAGIGNVFRADLLYKLKIHPERPGRTIDRDEFDDLWSTITRWLKIGVRYNRIITADVEEFDKPAGRLRREERLLVYKQEFCCGCGQPIESWKLAARTIYACTRCQS